MTYDYDAERRIWTRPGAGVGYDCSDGEEVEQRIGGIIASAEDVGVGSVELARAITDWPTYYHLSARRADLLRPFARLLRGRVLEVGAGCGAITRFLGEHGAQVTAVESSARRAAITASRCRDLAGVEVYVDALADLDVSGGFDAATLIGVLEYSGLYSVEKHPVRATIARCRELLAPDGVLIVAIENQLGLKYFAGAPEEHLGQPYHGIHDQYCRRGPVTYGRRELEGLLRTEGYMSIEFLYPFPDYKHARAVLTEQALLDASSLVLSVLQAAGAPSQGREYERVFSEERAWEPVVRNALAADLSNSFLVAASPQQQRTFVPSDEMLSVYATDRRRCFAKQTGVRRGEHGFVVERSLLYDVTTPPGLQYAVVLKDEPAYPGMPYVEPMHEIVNRVGWSVDDLAIWARPWVEYLRGALDGHRRLPRNAVDLIPNNLVVLPGGELQPFDLEWVASVRPELVFVIVRGLHWALSSVRSVARPMAGTPSLLVDLVAAVARILGLPGEAVEDAYRQEIEFQAQASGRERDMLEGHLRAARLIARSADLHFDMAESARRVQESGRAVQQVEARAAHELDRLRLENAELRIEKAELASELAEIHRSTTWRASGPARSFLARRPRFTRALRRVAKLIWWTVTLQLRARLHEWKRRNTFTYANWIQAYDVLTEDDLENLGRAGALLKVQPLISVVMPVFDIEERILREAIESVLAQTYTNWELCIADDGSADPSVQRVLKEFVARDKRVKVVTRQDTGGISAASNDALGLASGEWIALLDHDDLLPPHALFMCAQTIETYPDATFIYSDVDKVDEVGTRSDPYFKPDWNPALFYSQNYVCHLTVFRRELAVSCGGFRSAFDGSQDWDLFLRMTAEVAPDTIHHIPHVLYHHRAVPSSTAASIEAKPYAFKAATEALKDRLAADGVEADVEPAGKVYHRVRYRLPPNPPGVSIIIPTTGKLPVLRNCLNGILRRTDYPSFAVHLVFNEDALRVAEQRMYLEGIVSEPRVRLLVHDDSPFNYSRANNWAVSRVDEDIICLLNDDAEPINKDWLRSMVGHLLQDGVGAVGAKLYYPDETIQHAGVGLGLGGAVDHFYRFLPRSSEGYFQRANLDQDLSCVTAACMLLRKAVFEEVGGFDESFAVAFNDVDLCIRIREAGWRIVWTPTAELYHHESLSLGQPDSPTRRAQFEIEVRRLTERWGAILNRDPNYSPNLSLERPWEPAFPPRVVYPWRAQRQIERIERLYR